MNVVEILYSCGAETVKMFRGRGQFETIEMQRKARNGGKRKDHMRTCTSATIVL